MRIYPIRIAEFRVLRAHNLYADMPVLKVQMELGLELDRASTEFPGFTDRLEQWLPGLHEHECSVGRPGGFLERMRRGTYLPHIAEHVCLELQNLMGFDVGFGRVRGTGTKGIYRVVVEYEEEEPARAAFDAAVELVLAAMHGETFDAPGEITRLLEIADEYRLGPSTSAIVQAARERRIPVTRLNAKGSLVQLGYGVNQKRIMASETTNTSAIAEAVCQQKPMTNRLLRTIGVPVPTGRSAESEDQAWAVAQEIGPPVVIKPESGNQGNGVSIGLATETQVREAYRVAAEFSRRVLVEQQVQGSDYRLLVINGEMVAAARRDPAQVVGDARSTVEQLVAETNKDPRRRPGHSSTLTQIRLDAAADLVLSQQGLSRESVPAAGQAVRLRLNANLSTGGTAADMTDDVHPRNKRMAELAAQILALDVAGVDFVCQDIGRPLCEQAGAIVEVNAAPGLRMHLSPTTGQPREVGKHIVAMLFPESESKRLPIISVTGTNGKTTVTRLIAHIFKTARKTVGMTCTDGIYIGEERIITGDCAGPQSAEAVLLHPHVEVAVLETARGGILREGLGYDGCDVGVVTNVNRDHLGLDGVETLEDLARVKQVVVDAVHRDGAAVLNADDPLVAAMAADARGEVIYFTLNPGGPVAAAHRADGGRCVAVEAGAIVLQKGAESTALLELEHVPFTGSGRIRFQVANALAGAAAAWGAGVNPAIIARALSTFETDPSVVPGRFNVMQVNGSQVIVDYGHNRPAMVALGEAVQALGRRRTVMALCLPGDRRDEDLIETFDATLAFVDEHVLYDMQDRRGRGELEVPRLLESRLPSGAPRALVRGQQEAIEEAWRRLRPGDRLIFMADLVDEAIETLRSMSTCGGGAEDSNCVAPVAAA